MKLSPELEAQVLRLAGVSPVPLADLTEECFQAEVLRTARLLGWRCYHTRNSRKSEAGFPDLVLVHRAHGLVIAELKVGDNVPTPDQLNWLEDLRAVGVRALVWRPELWGEIERTLRGE